MSDEITLPLSLANGNLTLEEIGAIFVLMCLPKLEDKTFWEREKNLIDLIDYFRKEGILNSCDDDKLELDLTWI